MEEHTSKIVAGRNFQELYFLVGFVLTLCSMASGNHIAAGIHLFLHRENDQKLIIQLQYPGPASSARGLYPLAEKGQKKQTL